jgi:hypothetical protein
MAETALARSIDLKKALELRLKGCTYEQIGVLLDPEQPFCKQGVQQALQRFHDLTSEADDLPTFQHNRAGLIDAVEFKLLASLADDTAIQKMNYRDRAVSYGIIVDKRRLETGQSTSNISVLGKIVQQADAELFKKDKSGSAS